MTVSRRFYALDVLRGLAIALMVLVNTPGNWSFVYSPLLHAKWDGFTFADIVFPGFLFVVGAAMAFSFKGARLNVQTVLKISKRAGLMFGCGLLLNVIAHPELDTLRIMGVLQRIALAYWLVALAVLWLKPKSLWALCGLLPALYWLLLIQNSGPFALETNLVRQWDLALLGAAHLYQGYGLAFDPEGLLSTLPACINVLIGYLVATSLQGKTPNLVCRQLSVAGMALVFAAGVLHPVWPVNKPLWSGSYVLLSSGVLVLLLALLVYAVDIKKATRVTEPLRVYGTNPLLIYMLSQLLAIVMAQYIVWDSAQGPLSVTAWLYQQLTVVFSAKLASLVYALAHVLLFWAFARFLYRRQIFIKL